MHDPSLFTAGLLFTQDYLAEGIAATEPYQNADLAAVRASFADILAEFPHASGPNEATTEKDFVWPVLQLLGWDDFLTQQNLSASGRVDVPDGLLFIDGAAKASANQHQDEWRRYEFGAAVVESKRWGRALDRAEGRTGADKQTPSTQLLRYLRRIDDLTNGALRWGILTNGAKWRLYFSGARSTIDDYLELDLARILALEPDPEDSEIAAASRDHWLAVFVALFSKRAFERTSADAPSFHDIARREAAYYEERVAKNLSEKVFGTLYPELGSAVAAAAPADTPLDEIRQATLILLYRLLFILYAEDRELLPVRERRFDDYAFRVARLDVKARKDTNDQFSDVARQYWTRFADLSRMIDRGDRSVGLPPYNGGLFNAETTPLLTQIALSDAVMAKAIDILSFEEEDGRRRYINYRDLSVQQLGSIYERLLEFELTRDAEGAVDVRPNTFARRNSGSYYTPDDLVQLLLDRTLAPLIIEAKAAFDTVVRALKPNDSEDYRLAALQKVDPASAIARLRVCDPAMGSGHFLVSLVDHLTNHALEAIDDARTLARDVAGLDYESPVAEEVRQIRAKIRHNAEDEGWSVSEDQLDDPQLVKRMILKRCIYGADKNPMAVELAKVALWLHTFTVGAPLSFIDHHLAAGDSLFGRWVREATDKAGKGGKLFLHEPLSNAQRQAVVMRTIESLTDAEVAEAHRSADMWRDVEAQTGPLDGFVSFMHALEWLALKGQDKALITLWLDGRFGDPIAVARGRQAPEKGKARAEEVERFTEIWRNARALIDEEGFLNWQILFPGVWDNWTADKPEGGFDAIVGNPPWDRIKLQQVEWFAARRPEIALAPRAADRTRMIKALKDAGDPLYDDYLRAEARAVDTARMARKSGHYPLLSGGDTNLNSLFVERAHALVRPGGMIGLLIPSGIASDQSSSGFFRKVVADRQLHSIIDFFNRRYDGSLFFPDVYYRFKFCAYVAGGEARTFDNPQFGFFIRDLAELDDPDRVFPISEAEINRINPNSGTAPIFRSRRDKEITSGIYERLPVLVDREAAESSWPVRYATMLHMANDSDKFRTRAELERDEGAWPVGSNRFQSEKGEWGPLYEGKMVQAFDHRASDIVVAEANVFRPGQGSELTAADHEDPARLPTPRYWVRSADSGWNAPTDWCLALKDVTSVTNMRTTIAAVIPRTGAGHTLPVLFPAKDASRDDYIRTATLLLANLNSVIFDYLARQKVHGNHLAWYLVEQLPFTAPGDYGRVFGGTTAEDILKAAVLEMTYTSHDLAPFARDLGYVGSDGEPLAPFVWDEERRIHLRAKIDALYMILYGVFDPADVAASRDNITYIYSTFAILERQDGDAFGCYRSRDLALAYINALIAGQPDAVVAG